MLKLISLLALLLTMIPCLMFAREMLTLHQTQLLALVGSVVWFCATPMWMSRPVRD